MVHGGIYCGIIVPQCNLITLNNLQFMCEDFLFSIDCDIRHFLSNVVGEMQPAGLIVIFILDNKMLYFRPEQN